jgi:hypothetical protein
MRSLEETRLMPRTLGREGIAEAMLFLLFREEFS